MAVPHIRRGDGKLDVLVVRRERKHQLRRLRYDQPALLHLAIDVAPAVKVLRDPETGEHVETVVERAVFLPLRGDAHKRFNDVRLRSELGKERARQRIPIAVSVGAADILGQQVQHLLVFGGRRQQLRVVVHRRGDKGVILSALAVAVFAVDEQPLHPQMADAARVAGQIHSSRDARRTAQTRAQRAELALRELRRLVHEDPVVFLPLILEIVVCAIVAKFDGRAVDEKEHVHRRVVACDLLRDHAAHRQDDALLQFGVFAADDQNAQVRIGERPAEALAHQNVGLAASSRSAVADVAGAGLTKQLLLGVEVPHVDIHRAAGVCHFAVCHFSTSLK